MPSGPSPRVKAGWLFKVPKGGSFFGTSKRRFFILRADSTFDHYESDDAGAAIVGSMVVTAATEAHWQGDSLIVTVGSDSLELKACVQRGELEEWRSAILSRVRALSKPQVCSRTDDVVASTSLKVAMSAPITLTQRGAQEAVAISETTQGIPESRIGLSNVMARGIEAELSEKLRKADCPLPEAVGRGFMRAVKRDLLEKSTDWFDNDDNFSSTVTTILKMSAQAKELALALLKPAAVVLADGSTELSREIEMGKGKDAKLNATGVCVFAEWVRAHTSLTSINMTNSVRAPAARAPVGPPSKMAHPLAAALVSPASSRRTTVPPCRPARLDWPLPPRHRPSATKACACSPTSSRSIRL